jgi:hypothetical protein
MDEMEMEGLASESLSSPRRSMARNVCADEDMDDSCFVAPSVSSLYSGDKCEAECDGLFVDPFYEQQRAVEARRQEEESKRRREEQIRQTRLDFERKRSELEERRKAIVVEKQAMEQQNAAAIEASAGPMIRVEGAPATAPAAAVDYTKIPAALDEALERLDTDGSLRPSIINVGKVWSKTSQEGLLGGKRNAALSVAEQKLEKNTCYDLLDALTRSGGLGIADTAMHIVVSTTHCFGRNLMDTLVKDNLNPIEKVEHTQLIVASHVFGKSAAELLKPDEVARVKQNSPALF